VPIAFFEGQGYSWQNWRDLQDGKGKIEKEDFDKAVTATPRESCVDTTDDLASSLAELDSLGQILDAKMAEHSPSLAEIRRVLTDCQTLAQEILSRKGPPPAPPVEETAEEEAPAEDGETPATGRAEKPAQRRGNTREEVYAQLAEVSAQLMRLEPHSPVAYMIQRAVKLSHLPFPELLRVLIRDQGAPCLVAARPENTTDCSGEGSTALPIKSRKVPGRFFSNHANRPPLFCATFLKQVEES
jgi:type VI secretion system protein ImpA